MLINDKLVAPSNPMPTYVVAAPVGGFVVGEAITEFNPLPVFLVDPETVPESVPTVGGGAQLSSSAATFVASAPTDTVIATLSQPFGVGTTYASVVADATIKLTGSQILRAAGAATIGNAYTIKIRAASADGSRELAETFSFTATAAPDVTAPTITSSLTASVAENVAYSITLTANEGVTFSLRSGADSASFTLVGAQLGLAAVDFEAGKTLYTANLRAQDAAGNQTDFTHAVTITDVAEGGSVSLGAVTTAFWGQAYNQSSAITNGSGTYGPVTGLPAGITANVVGSNLVFSGTPY